MISEHLFQYWIHAQEEDSGPLLVYRPRGYALPPARGRNGFEIRENGEFVRYRIAATDGISQEPGRWAQDGPDHIRVRFQGEGVPPLRLRIRTLQSDRLVVEEEK